jgi:NADPH2:quinone reductase
MDYSGRMKTSMKAVVIREPGDTDVLELRDVPMPEPSHGEVLVRVATSGVNRADLLQRRGNYPVPAGYPADILGLEYAGVVEGVGPGVGPDVVGRAVMGITGGGGYAEYVTEAASTALRVPSGVDVSDSGAIPEAYLTAYDAVFMQEGLAEGETLLVHAVGSGVGSAAVQMAKRVGARTIGTSRTASKLERASDLGLDVSVLADGDWSQEILDATDARGVDVILDLVGGPYLAKNQAVLAKRGRHIVVGVPGGPMGEINLRSLMITRGSIRGTVLRARALAEKEALARAFERDMLPGFAAGELRPVIDRVFAADQAADAHRHMEANANFGKILLRW